MRRGYVVITIDMFFWGERRMVLEDDPPEWKERPAGISRDAVTKFNQRSSASEQLMGRTLMSAGVTWAGIIAWDDLRTVDYLVSRPGGRPAAHRLRRTQRRRTAQWPIWRPWMIASGRRSCADGCAPFPISSPNTVRSTIGHTKLIPGIYRHLDHPDIASLAMPRPLMVINGIQDALFEPEVSCRA